MMNLLGGKSISLLCWGANGEFRHEPLCYDSIDHVSREDLEMVARGG
jgi:hypothetical protein